MPVRTRWPSRCRADAAARAAVPDNDKQKPPVVLDEHRGLAAQKATDERRHSSQVEADQEALRRERAELEDVLFAAPARDWPQAAERAAFLLRRFATTPEAQDPRYARMIAGILADFARLNGAPPDPSSE